MSKSAAVSLTGPSPSLVSPGARPPTGLTNSVPLSSASHPFRPDPYDVSHHSSEGPIPRSVNSSITPTVTPASLPLDGVTSTWVITCTALLSSQVSDTSPRIPSPCDRCRSRPGRAASASSTTAPRWAPSALSAPSPLPHRRHRLRDDRPRADPRGTAHAKASPTVRIPPSPPPPSHGICPPAGTRLARTPTAGAAHHLNARPRTPMPHHSP